ncbi:MAG TPA: hypothetical protein GX705_03345 [Clostridiales bacterium]|nr:hypothetical protein [Clostridiales bacterium]
MNYILNNSQLEGLNYLVKENIGDKNDLSILNNYGSKELAEEDKVFFQENNIINKDGDITNSDMFEILAKPSALAKFMLTGGSNKFEYTVSYDKDKEKNIAFTKTPEYNVIDDETKRQDITEMIGNFVGKTNLKSIAIKHKFSPEEAIVIAAMIDLERRTILRAFVDELPYTNNKYGVNMTWRMVHGSSKSIQWFVYCISEVIGEDISLKQDQVKDILDKLKDKGIVSEQYGQYQLSDNLSQLANRMIIINNIMTMETMGNNSENELINAGFTCIQSGVHDILLLDYDGDEVMFETISSELLIEYIDKFLELDNF